MTIKLPERDERMTFKASLMRDLIDYEDSQGVRIVRIEPVRGDRGEIVDVRLVTEPAK